MAKASNGKDKGQAKAKDKPKDKEDKSGNTSVAASDLQSDIKGGGDTVQARPMPITIHTQYVKDMSFENPNAPDSLRRQETGPQMDININLDASPIKDENMPDLYEVVITLRATANRGKASVFIAELHYGAVVALDGLPQDQHHPVLLIEVPRMIFPYARQILSDMTASGGYPPLLLNPVDFQAMYVERFKDQLQKSADQKSSSAKAS